MVRQNLARATKDATVVIVAQRVAAAMDADEVIVLDKGLIVGKGSHEELLQTCEVYKEIVASQIEEDEVAEQAQDGAQGGAPLEAGAQGGAAAEDGAPLLVEGSAPLKEANKGEGVQ